MPSHPLRLPILRDIAEPAQGYFSRAQAIAAGIKGNSLTRMADRGLLERISRGVYRLPDWPVSPNEQLIAAMLWPQRGVRAVLSHDTALALLGLSDVSPARIHLTLPRRSRLRRTVPAEYIIHRADLDDTDIMERDGVLVTTPAQTIRDCHAAGVPTRLLKQAIQDGERSALLTPRVAAELKVLLRRASKLVPR